MGKNSKIQWTHHSFSPWWGCAKVSDGCRSCYAESIARRFGHNVWGPGRKRRELSVGHWREPLKWNREACELGWTHRVFCGSMCDWAEDLPELRAPRARLFELIESTPNLLWLMLTKRPENIPAVTPLRWRKGWPQNTVAMTTVENQDQAIMRVPLILQVPARWHALSVEPMLGEINLRHMDVENHHPEWCFIDALTGRHTDMGRPCPYVPRIKWVVCGGESGPKARPAHPNWVRSLRDQCIHSGTPFFFKQWGEWATDAAFCKSNPPPKGVRIKPMWMRDDGEVSSQPLSITLGDEPADGEELEHTWVRCARIGKKLAGRHLDGVLYDEVLT